MQDNTDKIAGYDAILNAGISRVTVEGNSAEFWDMEVIRKLRAEAVANDLASVAAGRVRPSATTIKLGSF